MKFAGFCTLREINPFRSSRPEKFTTGCRRLWRFFKAINCERLHFLVGGRKCVLWKFVPGRVNFKTCRLVRTVVTAEPGGSGPNRHCGSLASRRAWQIILAKREEDTFSAVHVLEFWNVKWIGNGEDNLLRNFSPWILFQRTHRHSNWISAS